MIDHNHNDAIWNSGPGEWTPGAQEAGRFREDLHLRIVATAETMAQILDARAEAVSSRLRQAAASGRLHEDREAVETEAVLDSVEHLRFTYNWAHVMLATRVVDALKTWSHSVVDFRPIAKPSNTGKPPCQKRMAELRRLKAEFAERFGIEFSKCPSGDLFLDAMVLARNKIVHNGAMAWEASRNPDEILVEGAEEWSPSRCDRDFVARFPEYVDTFDRITVPEELFRQNVERAKVFVTWVGEHLDPFVQLLAKPSAGRLPS
jgi:hypothetical protein